MQSLLSRRAAGPAAALYGGRQLAYACAALSSEGTVRFTAVLIHEGDWYVARCLEVEVTSQGETIEAALSNLREALELYFEDEPLPVLQEPIVAPVEVRIPA